MARTQSTARTLLRGLCALIVLTVLLVAVPIGLWRLGVLPTSLPSWHAITQALINPDSGQLFLGAVTLLGWYGWIAFASSILIEAVAAVRHRSAPRIPALAGTQKLASALVGGIILLLPTSAAFASSSTPAAAATSTPHLPTAHQATATGHAPQVATAASVPSRPSGPLHHVTAHETLWDIAEHRLGDPLRWHEIAALNEGVPQADGNALTADTTQLQPGWVLRLPTDAVPSPHLDTADATTNDAEQMLAMAPGETRSANAEENLGDAPLTSPAASDTTASAGIETETHTQGGRSEHAVDYTVQPGDNLSQIAQDELGDAAQYPKIFQLNKGQPQPDGLPRITDEDLIYPGQRLDLPAAHATPDDSDADGNADRDTSGQDDAPSTGPHDQQQHEHERHDQTASPSPLPDTASPSTTAPSAAPTPSASTTKEGGGAAQPPASATPSPTRSAPAQPGPQAPHTPTTQPTQRPPASTSATATPPSSSGADEADETMPKVALAAGIGALLAASLAGALGVKRILQQRRRRAGETIAIDADPTRLEQVLNASAEPAGVALLDTVLRTLAHHAAAAGRELPAVRGARVTDRTVQLILDDQSTEVLPPFTAGDTPGTWRLDPAGALLDSDAACQVPAPYPGLVTLGATHNGDLLLADLLHTRALLLDGDPGDVLAVARALALEAGTSGWTDHTEIVTVGLGARLATLLPQGRIRTMPHLPSVVADLGALLVEVHQHSGDPEGAPEPLPWILICAGDVDAQQAWQLADAISAARHLPVAVVLPAGDATRQAFPDAELIPVAPDTQITLPQLGGPVQLQRLTDDQYRQYVHALEVADQPAQAATGAWQLAEDHDLAATAPRPGPHPLLLHHGSEDSEDPGNPFPALLASTDPSRIHLVKPTPTADNDGENASPNQDTASPATAPAPDDGTEPMPDADPPQDDDSGGDADAPKIAVLGPLKVTGITSSGHGPKVAALAALIYLRPGRTADSLCTAMDPVSPWSTRTLQSRLSEIRSRFGSAPDGEPYLPRPNKTGYAFHPAVRSDWDHFQRLASRGLATGPDTGIPDLENALGLIRGKPFDGQDYPWADSIQQEMLSRIVDLAHTLATWHTEADTPDLDAARHTALRGLDIDETAEVLYRDWMHIEWAAGNTTGVRKAVARVQQVARSYDISLEPLTEQTIDLVLSDRPTPAHAGRA